MKKYLCFGLIAVKTIFSADAQIRITPTSSLEVYTGAGTWGSAMRVFAPNSQTCSYNLAFGGQDKFFVCAEGWLWTKNGGYFGSDIKLKKNVTKVESALSKINQLNGVQFDYIQKDSLGKEITKKDTAQHGKRTGVIAQDVEKVFPGSVRNMPDGTKAVAYTDLIGALVEGMKEQQIQIESLRYQLDKQNVKSRAREGVTDALLASYLVQNYPNPFTESTVVNYNVANTAKKADIMIFDMAGNLIKTYNNIKTGEATITINADELKAGMYMYSLIVDGVELDSKRMILTK